MKNYNWKKLAIITLLGLVAVAVCMYVVLPLLNILGVGVAETSINLMKKYPVGTFIMLSMLGLIAYGVTHPKEEKKTKWEPKPTESDYYAVLQTLRPAVAEVAGALGLAPIYSHTDMAVDPEERIIPGIYFWGMKYKVPKRGVTDTIDEEQARRIIQAQVKTVLERDNPSRFTETRYNHHGSFEPLIQIDEVQDGEAYINIFAVIASETYFKNRKVTGGGAATLHTQAATDDTDF